MKRKNTPPSNITHKRRAVEEARVHQELNALAAQLRQIRMEYKFKYYTQKGPSK